MIEEINVHFLLHFRKVVPDPYSWTSPIFSGFAPLTSARSSADMDNYVLIQLAVFWCGYIAVGSCWGALQRQRIYI